MDKELWHKWNNLVSKTDRVFIVNGINKGFCDWYDEMKYAQIIIEADKESEEKE